MTLDISQSTEFANPISYASDKAFRSVRRTLRFLIRLSGLDRDGSFHQVERLRHAIRRELERRKKQYQQEGRH